MSTDNFNKGKKIMEAKLLKKNEWYTIDNGLGPIRAQAPGITKTGPGLEINCIHGR